MNGNSKTQTFNDLSFDGDSKTQAMDEDNQTHAFNDLAMDGDN